MRQLFGLTALVLAASVALAADGKFSLTGENTTIQFVGSKAEGKHDGGFKKITGTATVADGDPTTAKIELEIDVDSIYTDTGKLTNHLKSPDFFEVKKYPKAKFVSTKVAKSDDGYTVTGALTLHGKTKTISFPAKIKATDDGLTLTSDFKIDRHDFGVSFGKGKIHDDVALKVSVKATK